MTPSFTTGPTAGPAPAPPPSGRGWRRLVAPVAVVVGGLVLAVGLAGIIGASSGDTAVLVGWAAVGALVASVVGALVLRGFRRRSVRLQAIVVACVSLVAAVTGVLAAAQAMFISTHDLKALGIVLLAASAISIGAAMQLGDGVGAGARRVTELAHQVAAGDELAAVPDDVPGEFAALAAELHDLSARLTASRQRQEALEASRRELVAWVSHDIRSPIATIRAMAEALDDGVVGGGDGGGAGGTDDAATVARYHHRIRLDAEWLTVLVDDLFELSRINSGSLRLERQRVPLLEVVVDALAAASTSATVKGVTLVDDLGDLPALEVGAQELTRVLGNLLDNAIRHTPAGGRVVLGAVAEPDAVVLSVADSCGGIPGADLDRVFDVAFRGDASRGSDARGGGLGLAIAKGLVEAHDGTIGVANAQGGCRFTIRLPRPG